MVSKNLYGEHFGLSDSPFGITPDPRFSYAHSLYHEAFAKLRYGIEARKGFIVITGEPGTGKTTLLKAFMQSVESTVHTAFVFNPKLNFTQLVRYILTDLEIGCPSQDRFTLTEKLNNYLIEQLKKDHIVAILVDEAQDLSDELLEEIRLLSNLESDRSMLIQIVLMGQPELERRLDQPKLWQLKQRVAVRCRLTPLPSGEVDSYINHRLKKAGYQGKELFDAKAVERISLCSQGIPRLINVICDNALLIAYASAKKKISAEIIEEVARDLELTVPSRTQRKGAIVNFEKSRGRDERTSDQIQGDGPRVDSVSEEYFIDEQSLPEPSPKSRVSKVKGRGMGIFLGLVLVTGSSVVVYSQQNRRFVADVAMRLSDFSEQSSSHISDVAAKVERQGREYLSVAAMEAGDYFAQSKDYFFDLAVKMKSYFPQTTNYLSALAAAMSVQLEKINDSVSGMAVKVGDYFHQTTHDLSQMAAEMRSYTQQGLEYLSVLTAKARSSIAARWAHLRHVNSIQHSSPDSDPAGGLTPNDHPASADEKAAVTTVSPEDPELNKEAELNKDAAAIAESKKMTEPQVPKTPAIATDERAAINQPRDHPRGQPVESEIAPSQSEPPQTDREATPKRESQSFMGTFEVVQDSFLRDKPQSDAAITILPPGTQVRVESRDGDYLRVRSLNDPELRGYVHREDAFFERIR